MAIEFVEPFEYAESAAPPWQSMSSAPRNRPILLRSKWAGRPVAIVGIYVSAHGCHCTLPMYGHDEHQIFADGWAELPDLGDTSDDRARHRRTCDQLPAASARARQRRQRASAARGTHTEAGRASTTGGRHQRQRI
jgi:hypothetical protein